MKRVISSAIGAFAGIFIMLSLFQALFVIPEFKAMITEMINGIVAGLITGSVIAAIVGFVLLYISLKGRF